MTEYSDAALLTGDYAHMAAELRAGKRVAPSPTEWGKTSCDNTAEKAAQSVAQQIFAFQENVDDEKEQLEIVAICAAGPMIVTGLFPDSGETMRVDGHLMSDKRPVVLIQHVQQLSLTITKSLIEETEPENDGLKIGFVIFDELAKRADKSGAKHGTAS